MINMPAASLEYVNVPRYIFARVMVGEVIGNYRLLRKVGEGGMGAVYLAEHTLIGRRAAIKVLLRDRSYRPEVLTRFFNEARAATAVKHPGIVELYDFGYAADRSAYIVMEYLEGESLSVRLRRTGTLVEAKAAALCRQVAGGLGAAHTKGIVHRDLKPDNIYIVRDSDVAGGERAKILDFGIAKLPRGDVAEHSVTLDGEIVGTPAYMSPEQCKGVRSIDHRSDIYALGCILFKMVCGRNVFAGEGDGDVMAQHIYAPVPTPSSISPITPQLEGVILRALAKDPLNRFQSADEMIEALQLAVPSMIPVRRISEPTVTTGVAGPLVALPRKTTLSEASGASVRAHPVARRSWRVAAIAATIVGMLGRGERTASTEGEFHAQSARAATTATQTPDLTPPPSLPVQPSAPGISPSMPRALPAALQTPTVLGPTPAELAVPRASASNHATGTTVRKPTSLRAATAAKRVKITIASDPTGADVYRMPHDVRIGSTPLVYTVKGTGSVTLVLRRHGYQEQRITVPTDHDHERRMVLTEIDVGLPAQSATTGISARKSLSPSGSLNPFEKLERSEQEDK